MATFTITTPVNIDTLVGRTGDDTINVNGGFITLDEHSRHGVNANTSATIAAFTLSATLGGSAKIEGRYTRLIPFDGASGTVPAFNTVIAGASGSGKLAGIYSTALNAAPVTPGGAMPASGYALVKQWNGQGYIDNEALSGITANVCIDHILGSGTDRVGWVEIVFRGNVASNFTLNRLNNASDKVSEGLPYVIGVTTNNRATTYQIPSNGVNQYHGGVFVETGVGTDEYEPYPVTSDSMVAANVPTSALKGKWCKIDPATGLLRFGSDGTNTSGGYCPPAGLRIIIGNIFLTGADSAAKTQNFYSATVSAKGRFITAGAGRVDCKWTSFNFGMSSLTTAQLLNFEGCSFIDQLAITNIANKPTFKDCVLGCPMGFTLANITLNTQPVGIEADNFAVGKSGHGATANSFMFSSTDSSNIDFINSKLIHSGGRGSTTAYAINTSRTDEIHFENCVTSHSWSMSSTTNFSYIGGAYYNSNTPNDQLFATYIFSVTTLCLDILVDGVAIEDGDLPRNGLFNTGSSSGRITVRNLGAWNDIIGTGIPDKDDVNWSRSGTTVTVTASAHGLATGDTITVTRSAVVASIPRADYVVTVIDANNFTFTATNSGATSGKLSYFFGHMARLFLSAGTNDLKIQNVHATSVRTAEYGMANDCFGLSLENVTTDFKDDTATTLGANNMAFYGATHNPLNQTAISSVYGTHIRSGYVADVSVPNKTGLSWSRSSGTVTVTSPDHGLYTGSRIQVLFTDNQTGAYTAQIATVTVINKDTFTFVGANSGTTSGTDLSYKTADGTLFIDCNEPNADSISQFSVIAGTPLFTGAGSLLMANVNDEAEWVTERFITDFDHAENMLPFMAGGTISNYHLTYSIDTGAGYGAYQNAYYERTGGGGSAASTNVTVGSTTGINVGDYVYGIGIASGAKVASITNATTLVVDIANAAAVSGTLRFSHLPNITGLTADGFKMKIRCKTLVANTDGITFMRLFFRSTNTTRAYLYPQDVDTYKFELTNIPSGSIVAVYDSAGNELFRDNNVTSGQAEYNYIHSGVDTTDNFAVVWHEDYYPIKYEGITFAASDQSIYVVAVDDLAYTPSSTDISTFDFNNKVHVMDPTVSSGGQVDVPLPQLYSNWKDAITLSDNFVFDFAYRVVGGDPTFGTQSISLHFFQQNGWKFRPKEISHTYSLTEGVVVPESGGAVVSVLGTYTVNGDYQKPEHAITIALAGALTPTDIANLKTAVWEDDVTYDPNTKGANLDKAKALAAFIRNTM